MNYYKLKNHVFGEGLSSAVLTTKPINTGHCDLGSKKETLPLYPLWHSFSISPGHHCPEPNSPILSILTHICDSENFRVWVFISMHRDWGLDLDWYWLKCLYIKTTSQPVGKMSVVKKINKYGGRERLEPSFMVAGECEMVLSLCKIAWRLLRIWKTQLPFDPTTPLLGIYPRNTKRCPHKKLVYEFP